MEEWEYKSVWTKVHHDLDYRDFVETESRDKLLTEISRVGWELATSVTSPEIFRDGGETGNEIPYLYIIHHLKRKKLFDK